MVIIIRWLCKIASRLPRYLGGIKDDRYFTRYPVVTQGSVAI